MNFDNSNSIRGRFHELIPGGAHTYAKGDDQFPEHMSPYITRGKGSHVWDIDGNEFIEYGSGLRAVTLGHAFEPVIREAQMQLELGANFIRPARIELECAEIFLDLIGSSEMVKFCKNGSEATSAAIKLARAQTGKDMVAICGNHPFFSVDDWFIGSAGMPGGVPKAIREMTVKFHYNDAGSLEELFNLYPDRIAAVILEAEKETPPEQGFFSSIRDCCDKNNAIFILDEMITGFRWHNSGAQTYHGIEPDLSTFGKAMANGFSVSALSGKKDLMELGGYNHNSERVFLLSTTHGAETHGLAAAMATMKFYQANPVIESLWSKGKTLSDGLRRAARDAGVDDYVPILGQPCCLVYGSRDQDGRPSQPFRTLLMQEIIKRGILASSLVVNFSHSDEDIERTINVFAEAFAVYRRALDNGVESILIGRPVKPAIRKFA